MLTLPEQIPSWIKELPKVELHCHLEGAFPMETLFALLEKYETPRTITSLNDLRKKFSYQNFSEFVELWCWKNTFLRSYEDFTLIAREVGQQLSRQNVVYAEIFFSPSSWLRRGFEQGLLLEALKQGFAKIPGLRVSFIADLVRDFGPEHELKVLQSLRELKSEGLIGIGLGGSEREFPAKDFAPVFSQALKYGFHSSVHAGETAGPESIWSALRDLGAQRIGHGTTAFRDPSLMQHLKEQCIPIEICLFSNICTGVITNIAEHPFPLFFQKGLLVSLNTDDPLMFGNSLNLEFALAAKHFNLKPEDCIRLVLNAIESSWLPEQDKTKLRSSLTSLDFL